MSLNRAQGIIIYARRRKKVYALDVIGITERRETDPGADGRKTIASPTFLMATLCAAGGHSSAAR